MSEELLEDFTKHLLLFNNDGKEYYIVVNIGDQVDESNINDRKLLKDATKLMKDYSVSKSFIDFIKKSESITESERINHIKKIVPEIYLDYIIENDMEVDVWNWLPRNLIKKQLLSDTKYLSYLIKKDEKTEKSESTSFIVNYILSGSLTKKTIDFLENLFKDETISNMFQKTIDSILLGKDYKVNCSLTKSILKNIFVLEEKGIVTFNSFNPEFIGTLERNFKDDYLEYLDILINKEIKYILTPDNKDKHIYDHKTNNFFFDDERFKYLISHTENLDEIIQSWRKTFSNSLFSYCFLNEKRSYYMNNAFKDKTFNVDNLTQLLNDPLRSKFVFFEDFIEQIKENSKYNNTDYQRAFSHVIAQTDLSLIVDKCPNNDFFKNEIIKYYTSVISVWDGDKKYENLNFIKRLNDIYEIDKSYIDFINLNYLFNAEYENLDDIFDFDYNSEKVQAHFNNLYLKYEKETGYSKERELLTIKNRADCKNFIKKYDSAKWNNKNLIEIFNPIVNFDTDFDLSELKIALSNGDLETVINYCENNAEKIKNTFKRNHDDPFIKSIKKLNSTLMR